MTRGANWDGSLGTEPTGREIPDRAGRVLVPALLLVVFPLPVTVAGLLLSRGMTPGWRIVFMIVLAGAAVGVTLRIRRAVLEMRQLRRENRELRDNLQRAQDHIARMERLATLGETLAAVAHDINNPLTAILGFCELAMESRSLDSATRKHLEVVHSQAERCRRLLVALLPFSRKPSEGRSWTRLNELVDSVLHLREFGFRAEGITVEKDLVSPSPVIKVPPAEVQLAILNLVVNAEQALTEVEGGRTLQVRTLVENGQAVVVVEDNGPGVPEENREKIFESFFTTKPEGVGSGIGLVTARRAAVRWGGHLHFEPSESGGARFVLSWPCSSGEIPAEETEPMPEVGNLRVIAVDDEVFVRDFYRETLEPRGCRIRTFPRTEDAFDELSRELPDVLLVDCIRPGEVNAISLERLFHRFPRLRNRTILVTGEPATFTGTEELLTLLPKPFDQRDLLAAIRRVATRNANAGPSRAPLLLPRAASVFVDRALDAAH